MREGTQFAAPNELAKMPGIVIDKDYQMKLHLKLYSNKIGRKSRMINLHFWKLMLSLVTVDIQHFRLHSNSIQLEGVSIIDTVASEEVSVIDTFPWVSMRFRYLVLTNQILVFLVAILEYLAQA